jgi:hypothetical protein
VTLQVTGSLEHDAATGKAVPRRPQARLRRARPIDRLGSWPRPRLEVNRLLWTFLEAMPSGGRSICLKHDAGHGEQETPRILPRIPGSDKSSFPNRCRRQVPNAAVPKSDANRRAFRTRTSVVHGARPNRGLVFPCQTSRARLDSKWTLPN